MANPVTLQATPMRAVQPDGKDYYRLEFEEDFDVAGDGGDYHGNQAMAWKQDATAAKDFVEKAKGQLCELVISPSTKNADWAGTLDRATIIATGEVAFTKSQSSGGGGWKGGGGGKGGGNWETAQERLFKNLSIESQGSLARLVELAKEFVYTDSDNGPAFNAGAFEQAVNAVMAHHQKFARSTRIQAEHSDGGKPADALKGATPAVNPKPDLPPEPRPGHEQVVEPVEGVYQLGDDGGNPTIKDQALARYGGSVALLKQKYDTVFPDTAGKSFKDMSDFELACLVED